jgi:hypothetical protein
MKIILTLMRLVYERFLTELVLLKLPVLTGYLLRLSTERVYHPRKDYRKNPRHVLILSKAGFTEDAVNVLSLLPDVEVDSLRRSSIKAIARAFLPTDVDDNNYFSASDEAKEGMLKYRSFLAAMWPGFDPGGRFRAVVSGNFGYFAEREVAAALESIGVPFIILHKENLKTPGRVTFGERIYSERRGPFLGQKILVYNEIERDLMIRSGVVTPDRVEIVGMARLDPVHHWRRANAGSKPQPVILFFSFLPTTGMPLIYRKGSNRKARYVEETEDVPTGLHVTELCTSVHRTMLRLAEDYPEISVVIKTKGRDRDRQGLMELLGISHPGELPANMMVVHEGSPFDLICKAAVVCGFNSTALLESLAAGKPVVVPSYAESNDPALIPFILDLGNAVTKATSSEMLMEILKRFAQAGEPLRFDLTNPVRETLRYWLGNDDGSAGKRAAAVFNSAMQ